MRGWSVTRPYVLSQSLFVRLCVFHLSRKHNTTSDDKMTPADVQESFGETASLRQQDLEAKLRLSESQRTTLELSVLQMTETISALSAQITDLETRKHAESHRASSLEVKLSLETDARTRAEELAVEAVRWKEERSQYQWEAQGGNQSLEHDDASEVKSLQKLVRHLEKRLADEHLAASNAPAKDAQVFERA